MHRWTHRNRALSKFARYLFLGALLALTIAFVLLCFYSPREVEIVSDVFHPEYGSRRVTPLTTAEKSAFLFGIVGFAASLSSLVTLLISFYRVRPDATPTI